MNDYKEIDDESLHHLLQIHRKNLDDYITTKALKSDLPNPSINRYIEKERESIYNIIQEMKNRGINPPDKGSITKDIGDNSAENSSVIETDSKIDLNILSITTLIGLAIFFVIYIKYDKNIYFNITPTNISSNNTAKVINTSVSATKQIPIDDSSKKATIMVESVCSATPRIPPAFMDLDTSYTNTLDQIAVNYMDVVNGGCKGPYPLGPIIKEDGLREVGIELYVTNTSTQTIQVDISDTFNVKIHTDSKIADFHPAFARAAGSVGTKRVFPSVPLNTIASNYEVSIEAIDDGVKADYFSIEPGQIEGFSVAFVCENPGIYDIAITIPYRYTGSTNNAYQYRLQKIICPKKMSLWIVNADTMLDTVTAKELTEVYRIGDFIWNGKDYTIRYSDPNLGTDADK